jgi:hypothetical protein
MSIVGKLLGVMSRRRFLKICVTLPTLTAIFKMQRWRVTQAEQPPARRTTYGAGVYGQGPYPGYRVHLPLIYKEKP